MHKWIVQNRVVEMSDYDYYNYWLGVIGATDNLGGLLSGSLDIHNNLLKKHAQFLHENIRLVENPLFSALLQDLEAQFMEIISLDQEAIAKLARILNLEMPRTTKEFKRLYQRFRREESTDHQINAQGFLSHPDFVELRQRSHEISAKMILIKEKLVAFILTENPNLAQSKYLP